MAISYTEYDSRIDALVEAFKNERTGKLMAGLPSTVEVYKGPYREEGLGPDWQVFISRRGVPEVKYDMGTQTADITMGVDVAAASYSVAGEEEFEEYVSYFAANVTGLLFEQVKRIGTDGWYKGIFRGSDAISLRTERAQTTELEVFQFELTFEVNYV